jgi:hypothetical protein
MAIVISAIIAATVWVARKGLPGEDAREQPNKGKNGCRSGFQRDTRFILLWQEVAA